MRRGVAAVAHRSAWAGHPGAVRPVRQWHSGEVRRRILRLDDQDPQSRIRRAALKRGTSDENGTVPLIGGTTRHRNCGSTVNVGHSGAPWQRECAGVADRTADHLRCPAPRARTVTAQAQLPGATERIGEQERRAAVRSLVRSAPVQREKGEVRPDARTAGTSLRPAGQDSEAERCPPRPLGRPTGRARLPSSPCRSLRRPCP